MKRVLLAIVLLLTPSLGIAANRYGANNCPGVLATPQRIQRAQIFTAGLTLSTILGKRDIVWSDNQNIAQNGVIFSGQYFPGDRDPVGASHNTASGYYNVLPQSTYVEYLCDRATPAYEFSNTNFMPLDVSNSAVVQYMINYVSPLVISKGYGSWNADNIAYRNVFLKCGHYDSTGTWVAQYSGSANDALFSQNMGAYLYAMGNAAHADGKCLIINNTYSNTDLTFYGLMMAGSDGQLDEGGFLRDGVWQSTNANLIQKITTLRNYARYKVLISIDQICSDLNNCDLPSRSSSLAIHLLLKGPFTSLSWRDSSGFTDFPEYYLIHGNALEDFQTSGTLLSRRFEKAIGLLNTSSSTPSSVNYTLPVGTWYDNAGTTYSGTIAIPAGPSGLALFSQPLGPVP
jgi:hypothetical protein